MNKASKVIFLLLGCVMPVLIGCLHVFTHYNELVTPEIRNYLQKEILILGTPQSLWNTWGVVSFMMGVSFVIIGVTNGSIILRLSREDRLPALPVVALLLFQLCVVQVGYEYDQSFQFFGGIFGAVLILICLALLFVQQRD